MIEVGIKLILNLIRWEKSKRILSILEKINICEYIWPPSLQKVVEEIIGSH